MLATLRVERIQARKHLTFARIVVLIALAESVYCCIRVFERLSQLLSAVLSCVAVKQILYTDRAERD